MPERGTTHVPDAVIAKLISQAATEIDGVGSAAGGVMGVGQRRDFAKRPNVDVELFGNTALVKIELGLSYPHPLEATGERVRTHVAQVLLRDVGIDEAQIDIRITWLRPAGDDQKRRTFK